MYRIAKRTAFLCTFIACVAATAQTATAQQAIVKKGSISVGVHEFEAKASTLYMIQATGDGFRPQISMSPGRLSFGRFDFKNRDQNSANFYSGENSTQTLYITVDGFGLKGKGPFDYTLKLTPLTLAAKPVFSVEGTLAENDPPQKLRFINHKHHKAYKVKMTAGKTYIIDMMKRGGAFLDCFLYLNDNAGKTLKSDDDGGVGLNSRIMFEPSKSGEYTIIATGLGKALGDFTLTVRSTK